MWQNRGRRGASDRSPRFSRHSHKAYFAALALTPGKVALVTDVCVPVSRLAQLRLGTTVVVE